MSLSQRMQCENTQSAVKQEARFALDSPLEGDGFEPSVPVADGAAPGLSLVTPLASTALPRSPPGQALRARVDPRYMWSGCRRWPPCARARALITTKRSSV